MSWLKLIVLLAAVGASNSINKPVFKIVLTQKGFAQFLQYDIDIPPIKEFTFCTWIKFESIDNDQSIFTYVVNGNNHVIRLWLDSGGEVIRISVDDRASFEVPVDIAKETWRHICFSYQSDFGAWALYIDARLISCEATHSLYGHIIPGGGSILVGYGISTVNGIQNGVQGEIFGVNMILASTIERNYTDSHPLHGQKSFVKDKVKHDDIEYTVLKDLKIDDPHEIKNELAGTPTQFSNSFIYFKTPDSFIEHKVGKTTGGRIPKQTGPKNEEEIFEMITEKEAVMPQKVTKNPNDFDFWNLVDDNDGQGKFKVTEMDDSKPIILTKHAYPMLPEYETPPSIIAKNEYSVDKSMELGKPSVTDLTNTFENKLGNRSQSLYNKRQYEISEIETPPLPVQDLNVYGQWTSSKYAGSVLNYLKSINFHNQDKKIPPTIHLNKVSDAFPYATDLKVNLIKPSASFKRKNVIIENSRKYYSSNMYNNGHSIKSSYLHRKSKRHVKMPQINVQIVDNRNRDDILKTHAETKPVNVEITPRSKSKKVMEHRFYRNTDVKSSAENNDVVSAPIKPKPFTIANNKWLNLDLHKTNSLLTVLPFLKSIEYFTDEEENSLSNRAIKNSDMYSKSLQNRNKWHNIKSYNNDFTPRRINMNPQNGKTDLEDKISEVNIKHPSIRIKYKPEINKVVENREDEHIKKGRILAGGVSNQSDHANTVSILKYNHGYLPGHDQKSKKTKVLNKVNKKPTGIISGSKNFAKRVKIGNALNEQDIIGKNSEEKKKSFVGGNKNIPDIQRYRSVFDNETNGVPNSLRPRVCNNVELYNRLLYVQPDESIDMTHILSPIKKKNIGIQFIIQNYKKCSLDESPLRKNKLLLIEWHVTPVRLFGGARPKKTTDLCGFF